MASTQYNSSLKSSKTLFRQRSISSLPSRQFSVMNIINERQTSILKQQRKKQDEKSNIVVRDNEISKLRRNLQTAVSTALNEKLQNVKKKQQLNEYVHMKAYFENKIKNYDSDLKKEKENCAVYRLSNEELAQNLKIANERCLILQQQIEQKVRMLEGTKGFQQIIQKLKLEIKDIDPLKSRIIGLEEQVRDEKVNRKSLQQKIKQLEATISTLQKQIATTKPREQQLRQRIVYYQRVTLDLSRKMQDYNRRENDYIKQITSLKLNLTKVTSERNNFKIAYQETVQKLEKKIQEFNLLTIKFEQKLIIIGNLEGKLEQQRKIVAQLRSDIQGKNMYYKKQGEQNIYLKQKNKLLQAQQHQLRQTIQSYVRIADEVNLSIVQKIQQAKKLKNMIQITRKQLSLTEQKFQAFNHLVQEGTEKGLNQIRNSYFAIIRLNNQLAIQIKDQAISFNEKVMTFGEERDSMLRNMEVRKVEPPTDQTQLKCFFQEKIEQCLLFEKSNDQLLKIKKDLENKIDELLLQIQKEKKEMNLLKLKTADLFRAKKDLEDARKALQRYQQMIEEDKEAINDLKSQVSVMRQRNNELNEKNFVIDLQKRNLQVKLKEVDSVMKELNIEVLMSHKQINEKNSHLMTDSLQKLQSAIKSLNFYFNCAFCGQLPATPVTLALCGHTYCTKCKEAYSESCYECDTGQPIQKVFQNKFLKDASGKYRFLIMVLSQLKANFAKKE